MSVTSEQFDRAFREYQEFGPRGTIPVAERWREILPDVHPDEFPALERECYEIRWFAVELYEQVRCETLSDEAGRARLIEKYPFLTREQLIRTWVQASF